MPEPKFKNCNNGRDLEKYLPKETEALTTQGALFGFWGYDTDGKPSHFSGYYTNSHTTAPIEILSTGNKEVLQNYLNKVHSDHRDSSLEKKHLVSRLEVMQFYDEMRKYHYTKKKKLETSLVPVRPTYRPNLKGAKVINLSVDGEKKNIGLREHQSTGMGCWSCAIDVLLQAKGINLDQRLIRRFRGEFKQGKEPESPQAVDIANGNEMNEIFENGNIITKVCPNVMVKKTDTRLFQACGATQAGIQMIKDLVGKKHIPVAFCNGLHWRTIIGIVEGTNQFLCADSGYGDGAITVENFSIFEKYVDPASGQGRYDFTWIEDLDMEPDGRIRGVDPGMVQADPKTGMIHTGRKVANGEYYTTTSSYGADGLFIHYTEKIGTRLGQDNKTMEDIRIPVAVHMPDAIRLFDVPYEEQERKIREEKATREQLLEMQEEMNIQELQMNNPDYKAPEKKDPNKLTPMTEYSYQKVKERMERQAEEQKQEAIARGKLAFAQPAPGRGKQPAKPVSKIYTKNLPKAEQVLPKAEKLPISQDSPATDGHKRFTPYIKSWSSLKLLKNRRFYIPGKLVKRSTLTRRVAKSGKEEFHAEETYKSLRSLKVQLGKAEVIFGGSSEFKHMKEALDENIRLLGECTQSPTMEQRAEICASLRFLEETAKDYMEYKKDGINGKTAQKRYDAAKAIRDFAFEEKYAYSLVGKDGTMQNYERVITVEKENFEKIHDKDNLVKVMREELQIHGNNDLASNLKDILTKANYALEGICSDVNAAVLKGDKENLKDIKVRLDRRDLEMIMAYDFAEAIVSADQAKQLGKPGAPDLLYKTAQNMNEAMSMKEDILEISVGELTNNNTLEISVDALTDKKVMDKFHKNVVRAFTSRLEETKKEQLREKEPAKEYAEASSGEKTADKSQNPENSKKTEPDKASKIIRNQTF